MPSDEPSQENGSGVQALIDRIRDDGVKAARDEAARIVREARQEAATILAEARKEAAEAERTATTRIAAEEVAARESLQLAARDTIKDLSTSVRDGFERHLKRLVSNQLTDRKFMRKVVLALAGQTGADTIHDRPVQILLSEALGKEITGNETDNARAERKIREFILGISGDSLREGIEFKTDPDLESGVTVRVIGEDLQLDLNEDTISGFLIRHLLPRYRQIFEGKHDADQLEK